MDRKSIIILALCFASLWYLPRLVNTIFPPIPVAAGSTNHLAQSAGTTSNSGSSAVGSSASAPVANGVPAILPDSAARLVIQTNIPEELVTLTNENAIYTFTSRGGGIKEVHLLKYPELVSRRGKASKSTELASLNGGADAPVLSIVGDDSLQGDGVYKLSRLTNGLKAEKALANGVVIAKEFHFSTNYLVNASVRFENKTAQGVAIPSYEIIAGTSTPMSAEDSGLYYQNVLWYNGSKTFTADQSYFNTNTSSFFGIFPRTPKTQYLAGNNDLVWLSAQNQYFSLAVMPEKPPQSVVVTLLTLPELTTQEIADNPSAFKTPHGLKAALVYPGVKLENGQSLTNQYRFYIGPKEYETLSGLAAKFNNDFDLVMNFGWLAPVSKALLIAMTWMHSITGWMYGLLIIILTVILKLVFWPITKASTRSAKRMQELQPQLKVMQEKYKDDPQKLTAKQWEFYKENKVNPLSGCLPMLLQVPVFIGFYSMLRTAIELRGAHFLWMADLSKSDTLFHLALPFHYLGFSDAYFPINPMPLLLGCTQLWQASLMPMSPSMDASQQKMMRYMPLMALLFMYTQSSGLALYWTVSNLLSILQTKLTKTDDDAAKGVKAPINVTPKKIKK